VLILFVFFLNLRLVRRILFYTFLILLPALAEAQPDQKFSSSFTGDLFGPEITKPKLRKFMNPQKLSQKLNPLFYIGGGLMFVYQNVFSEQLQSDCTYRISCSEYTRRCIQRFGILKGTLVGLHQLQTCVPGAYLDYDKFFLTDEFKVDNSVYLKP
jgi:putative component of membrane protein insertase Oxa1/YidC/SpoIIIJ protein YidD